MLFKLKQQSKKQWCQLLSSIVSISDKTLPTVTITQYLTNDITYQLAEKIIGKIDHSLFHRAFTLEVELTDRH
jgi:hypothetical protein